MKHKTKLGQTFYDYANPELDEDLIQDNCSTSEECEDEEDYFTGDEFEKILPDLETKLTDLDSVVMLSFKLPFTVHKK